MIIMINGAFGSGKTSAAAQLQPRITNSMIFDPEEVGYMLRKLIPEEQRLMEERTDDFQDIELWRVLTVQTAREIRRKYGKHLIVPMTIYKEANFHYISNGFKEFDADVYHFSLIASEETIHQRLVKRGDVLGGWTYQQAPKCLKALGEPQFAEHIITDLLDTGDIVNIILERVGHKAER